MFGPMMEVKRYSSTSSPVQLPWERTGKRISVQQVICERNTKNCQEESEFASHLEGLLAPQDTDAINARLIPNLI